MFTEEAIIIINITCIAFMSLTMATLVVATRLKNGAGYMALASVATTLPVYLSNLLRATDSAGFIFSIYAALTINALCFPAMWFYMRTQLDSAFRIRCVHILHLLPAAISLCCAAAYYAPMNGAQIAAERAYLNAGNENLPALVNDTLLFGQFFLYFMAMFRIVYRYRRMIMESHADPEYMLPMWMPRFLWLFFALFLTVMVAYLIAPRTDVWLIPILNTLGMAYLTYCAIRHSSPARTPATSGTACRHTQKSAYTPDNVAEMSRTCDKVCEYLLSTKAYLRPDLSLADLAAECGIPQRALSRAINTLLHRNFFEFINELRIDEAKRRLLELRTADYNIDSIYTECGFRSRSTFFLAFKRATGKSPAAWLAENQKIPVRKEF